MSQSTPHSQLGTSDFLKRAYAATNASESRALYDEWAASYDQYLEEEGYAFPEIAASALVQALPKDASLHQLNILDAGCGTGLVGAILARCGAKSIDGLDVSPGMLEVAKRSGAYKTLGEADLTKPIARSDNSYDAVVCVGVLTEGHVGPQVLNEFVRVVKHGGLITATVLDSIWDRYGFKVLVDRLAGEGRLEIVRSDIVGITKNATDGARLLVLKKL